MQALEKIFEGLQSKLDVLKHALDLSGALRSDDYIQIATDVDNEMSSIFVELQCLRTQVEKEKEKLLQQQQIKLQCELLQEHLLYTSSNLPARLPYPSFSKPSSELKKDDPCKREQPVSVSIPSLSECEFLRLLTTEQFEAVPKYIKGRLQYDKVNSVVEKLNEVFSEKYKILRLKKKSMSENNRKRYDTFKSQENNDTKGVYFIIDRDIEDFSTLKMDNTLRNILTMLRHCGLMHEIRGGGCVRYACYTY